MGSREQTSASTARALQCPAWYLPRQSRDSANIWGITGSKKAPPAPLLSSPLRKRCVWSRGPAGYAHSWQERTYLPAARKEVSGQRQRKGGGVGVCRCKQGTYTGAKKKDRKKTGAGSFASWAQPAPAPAFPSTAVRPFSPRGSGVPQLRNSWETCPGLQGGQKTPPRGPALSARREGSMVSHHSVPRRGARGR